MSNGADERAMIEEITKRLDAFLERLDQMDNTLAGFGEKLEMLDLMVNNLGDEGPKDLPGWQMD